MTMGTHNIVRIVLTVLVLGLLAVLLTGPIRAHAALVFHLPQPYNTPAATTTPHAFIKAR